MENPLDMTGQSVIVTGGGKGVGLGITEAFLAAGANVLICGRSEPETLPASGGREAVFTTCDVKDYEQIEACVDMAVAKFGRLDVLVNNAGGAPYAEAATVSPRFSESIIRLNLIAPLNFSQVANRVMQTQESGGSIINIASVSTIRPSPGTAAYGAAKAGLVNLGTSLAVEWAPKVRVNALVVGLTQTEQSHLHYGDEAGIAAVGQTIPLGRMAVPRDIGNACLFLASSLSSYVSGTHFAVHGGGEKPAFLDAANTAN
ncbi:MAG: SDR family oxidoreductase [Halioglobus sp.]